MRLETVVTLLLLICLVLLRELMIQKQIFVFLLFTYKFLFSNVRCGQMHCQNAGDLRISVNANITIGTLVGQVQCKYVSIV